MFEYAGEVTSSKSEVNRLLLLSSYGDFSIAHKSRAEDVLVMERAIRTIKQGPCHIDCGEAGTVFRFLALRVSRIRGCWRLRGSERLLNRPHEELLDLLAQLGVKKCWELNERGEKQALIIESRGEWEKPQAAIQVSLRRSSQFASALLLNAWRLPFEIIVQVRDPLASLPYLAMTQALCAGMGMDISGIEKSSQGQTWRLRAQQIPNGNNCVAEADWSSAFCLAALAGVGGRCELSGLHANSLQPDSNCVNILRAMGIPLEWTQDKRFVVGRGPIDASTQRPLLKPVSVDLVSSPDLFPVLAILCAFANGKSQLAGLENLEYKESHRLERIKELLDKAACQYVATSSSIEIMGPLRIKQNNVDTPLVFDAAPDHRLAMAALVLKAAGVAIDIKNLEVLKKSFPELLEIIKGCDLC